MRRYIIFVFNSDWIKELQWKKLKKQWNIPIFFRLRHTSESHSICAELTLDMKQEANKRMQWFKRITRTIKRNIKLKGKDYAISNMKNI